MKRSILLLLAFFIRSYAVEQEKNYYQILELPSQNIQIISQEKITEQYQKIKQQVNSAIEKIQKEIDTSNYSKETNDWASIYNLTNKDAAQEMLNLDKQELEQIEKAYATLNNPEKRKEFDEQLTQRTGQEQQQKKEEFEKEMPQFNKDLEGFLKDLVNADLTTQKENMLKKLQDLGDRLAKLEENYTGYEIQPHDDLLWALQDAIKKEMTYPGRTAEELKVQINNVLETDPLLKFNKFNTLLFTTGLEPFKGGKFGGIYWLIYDPNLRENVFEKYLEIIKNLITQKNSDVKKVVSKVNEIINILGNNFKINQDIASRFNLLTQEAKNIKPVTPPKPKTNELIGNLENFTEKLNHLNQALSK